MRRFLGVSLSLSLITVLATLTLTSCGGTSSQDDNVFVVGMEAGYPPSNWTQLDDSNGAVQINGSQEFAGGYDVEIAKRIADGLGKELVVEKIEWDGLVPALTSGQIDGIIAGMSPTASRKETIDFSDSYYETELVLLVRNGGGYENATTLDEFAGARVTAQLNTFHYGMIEQIEGVDQQEAMSDFASMRVALETGMIDAYVTDVSEAISAESANSNFVMVRFEEGFETNPEDTQTAVGLRKDYEFTNEINEVIATISRETQEELMNESIQNQPINN